MKSKFTTKIASLFLALVIIFSLTSCIFGFNNPKDDPLDTPKDDILTAIDSSLAEDTKNYSFVYQYLMLWGVSGFDAYKFSYYEAVFDAYYNFEDGLPKALDHAADTAKLFIENYYDVIDLNDSAAVTDALLNCYVYATGDAYAYYRTADQFAAFEDDMSGTFGGIGIEIEYNHIEETLLVNRIFEGGPAEAGGMKVGDYIIGVDGMTFEEMGGYANVVYYVRGEVGTTVTVKVDRKGEILDLTMTRALITEVLVDYYLTEEGYGYVRIASFKEKTLEQFQMAIEALEELGAVGFIFDVRSNPGGYVYSVVDVMSYILPSDKAVISYEYKNSPTGYDTTHDDVLVWDEEKNEFDHTINLPMVIICDEYTASAGEIFVACLRDYEAEGLIDDVVIVGQTTFGKGIMQGSVEYRPDKSYVTLTVAYYNPPSGVNYHGIGIAPDVEVALSETEDTQLTEAINQLKTLLESK